MLGILRPDRRPRRILAAVIDTREGPYVLCGGPGDGKSTVLRALEGAVGLAGRESPYPLSEGRIAPGAVWFLNARRRSGAVLRLDRISPVMSALRVLEHVEGTSEPETHESTLAFVRAVQGSPCFDVTLPRGVSEARAAIAEFAAARRLTERGEPGTGGG